MKRLIGFVFLMGSLVAWGGQSPNILFISIDDLRPELGCYGKTKIHSPEIDELARRGTVFEEAYCQVPVCGASRASLMTGLYPTENRFVTYYAKAQSDARGIPDIPTWFKQQGYTTISNGKIYHDRDDSAASWDKIFRAKDYKIYHKPENQALPEKLQPAFEDADVGDEAYAGGPVLEETLNDLRKAKESGKPFFLAVGFTKPHLPFNAPKKYWDLYDRESIELADNPFIPKGAPVEAMHEWNELRNMYGGIPAEGPVSDELARTLIHGYYACVSYSDAMVGHILDELDRLDLRKNTIIVLWGDHGWQLGEHSLWCKHALFRTSLRAPLVISAPQHLKGQKTASLVEFVDIYPTLCELAGVEMPDHLDGVSLVPILKRPKTRLKEAIYGKYHSGDSVKTASYQYTEWGSGAQMLYDHTRDSDENVNVVDDPDYASIVKKMATWLDDFREKRAEKEPLILAAAGIEAGDNFPPVWRERTVQFGEATVGAIFGNYVNWLASDREGDALTYAIDSGPSWLQLVNAQYGRIEGTPSAEHVGENVAIISVTDGVNPPVSVRLEIVVLPKP
jgi:arylsulfatase A-like enzyme